MSFLERAAALVPVDLLIGLLQRLVELWLALLQHLKALGARFVLG